MKCYKRPKFAKQNLLISVCMKINNLNKYAKWQVKENNDSEVIGRKL